MALKVGDVAPNFTLSSTTGEEFSLRQTVKSRACILFFYPKDFTTGCTKEACEFRDHFVVFKDLEIDVYGISTDSVFTHQKFKKKHNLPFDLLADKKGKVSKLYDAHIPIVNLSKRVTYLLNNKHVITAVYNDMFGAEKHLKMMLDKII